ncbi:hypothetical protein GPECTOR_13g759 [Gonium pectorale]|uniref:Cyclic nucleotide-binding domain-containing protein n=1 Tax=Gonium pectorale TaxID=33097 RepID=A0A150GNG5_GONPE|nr:hypothetical protein GPECTOR_13g759 [Gonium pectorale]|eukprot:KXZ51272.1 hypothetical protein GPECTOR_13g759 [Gonium pectorale]
MNITCVPAPVQTPGNLQTVEEVHEHERWSLIPDIHLPTPTDAKLDRSANRSQRPLDRKAKEHAARHDDIARRSVYLQEGDAHGAADLTQTVAELMKEEEYGVFRLVVPNINLDRKSFDAYVQWLDGRRPVGRGEPAAWTRSIFGLPLLRPYHPLCLFWMSVMMLVDLTWTAFGVPVNVAFCSIDYGATRKTACTGTDLAFGLVYFLNLIFSFQMGVMVVNGHRKKAVMDGRRLAHYYIRHGRFVLDLAAAVPFVYLSVVLAVSRGAGSRSKWVNILSLIRLVRLLRLVSISKVIQLDSSLGVDGWLQRYLDVSTLYVVAVGFQILVLMNLLACVLVLLAYLHGLDQSWMTAVSWTDLSEASKPYQWYCALYWIITTTTTTGFGDFSPRWWGEQVCISLAMVAGMLSFGLLVATVSNSLARASVAASRRVWGPSGRKGCVENLRRLQAHIKRISKVNQWLGERHLRPGSKMRIQEYFAQVFVAKQTEQYGEAELFADLPPYLRFEVASELSLPLLRQVHSLRDLNEDAQQLIAAHFRPVRAIMGQELCRQGDEADRLWLLASGRLVALRHKEAPQHVAAPSVVGESLILAIDVPPCRGVSCGRRVAAASSTGSEGVQFIAVRGLAEANIEDGSLQELLGSMVEGAMVRDGLSPEALLGLPLDIQQQAGGGGGLGSLSTQPQPPQPPQQPPQPPGPQLTATSMRHPGGPALGAAGLHSAALGRRSLLAHSFYGLGGGPGSSGFEHPLRRGGTGGVSVNGGAGTAAMAPWGSGAGEDGGGAAVQPAEMTAAGEGEGEETGALGAEAESGTGGAGGAADSEAGAAGGAVPAALPPLSGAAEEEEEDPIAVETGVFPPAQPHVFTLRDG